MAIGASTHPGWSFALDIIDKGIKLLAVLIGGAWTWWNYKKSRTYAQRLELDVTGNVFVKDDLYIDINAVLKNLGATQHVVQQEGTSCELIVVRNDLTEQSVRLFPVFAGNDRLEPGEAINDTLYWRIARPLDDIVWIKLHLRVVSDELEWNASWVTRVDDASKSEVIQEEVD